MSAPILVPLDGSAFAARALPVAAALARRQAAPLHLVAVHTPLAVPLELPNTPVYDTAYDDAQRDALRRALAGWAARLTGELGVPATADVLDGDAADVLATEAARRGVALVVMTTHGRGGFQRAWLGSVADALVRRGPAPVLLVRPSPAPGGAGDAAEPGLAGIVEPADLPLRVPDGAPFRRILVPLDGSALAEEVLGPALRVGDAEATTYLLLRVARAPASALPLEMTFLTAEEEGGIREARAEAERYVASVASRLRADGRAAEATVVADHDAARAILRAAHDLRADLVAVATRGHGGLARLRLGSVADEIVRGGACPTLVVRPGGA